VAFLCSVAFAATVVPDTGASATKSSASTPAQSSVVGQQQAPSGQAPSTQQQTPVRKAPATHAKSGASK